MNIEEHFTKVIDPSRLYSTKEVAEITGRSRITVRQWKARGRLHFIFGKTTGQDLLDLMASCN